MGTDRRAILFTFWTVLICAFSESGTALREVFVEDLCNGRSSAALDLREWNTGMLTSFPDGPVECTLLLDPGKDFAVVLSLYRYTLDPEDELIIVDADRFRVSLKGQGDFPEEQKSFVSNGRMTIVYKAANSTRFVGQSPKFQFVFTRVHDAPCYYGEFKCRNRKCIDEDLVCDRHNHCGDNSDQEDCGMDSYFSSTFAPVTFEVRNRQIAVIVTISITLFVLVVLGVVIAIVVTRKKKKEAEEAALQRTAVDAAVPQRPTAPVAEHDAQPSVFSRIRQSFRRSRSPDHPATLAGPRPESRQPASVYPEIPPASDISGVENPEFKIEE